MKKFNPKGSSTNERQERLSPDRRAEGAQPPEVEGAEPCGARLWIHGADDGRPNLQRSRDDKGKSQHCNDKPRLQHVQTSTD